jgi:uncharacterized membrane protein
MNASLPFRTSPPRPRRPILGTVLIAVSYAVPILLVPLFNIVNGPLIPAIKELQNRPAVAPGDWSALAKYAIRVKPNSPISEEEIRESMREFNAQAVVTLAFVALLVVVTLALRWLFKYGAALRKLDAIELIKTDPRAPVLYLRSFNDDASVDYTGSINPLGPRRTVEMRLAKAFRSVGPVISIGRPGERLPELGANRFYVADADWQQAVRYFLDRAAAIIIVVGRSTGVTWEMTTALRNVPLGRLLFVFPYLRTKERQTLGKKLRELSLQRRGTDSLSGKLLTELRKERETRYRAFCSAFHGYVETELPLDLGSSIFLDFTEAGSSRLLPTRQPLFIRGWRDQQGVTVDYQRTLRPFLEKLQNRVIQPDWVERIVTHRASLVAFTIVCTAVTIAAFPMGAIIGFNLFGVTEFFLLNTILPAFLLMVISGNLAGYGVWNLWNLARTTQPPGHTLGAGSHQTAMPGEQALLTVDAKSTDAPPAPSLVAMTHVVYGLLALSLVTGIPAILAVIANYVTHREARGTYLDSHFRWQIRTFWVGVLWLGIALVLACTIILAPFALAIIAGLGVWMIRRIVRGWLALKNHEAIHSRREAR